MNIPIYRARRIDSDEYYTLKQSKIDNNILTPNYIYEYIEGFYWQSPETLEHFIAVKCDLTKTLVHIGIDPSTLAIHFPDSINTNSEKVWYNLEEISNIIKDYENGKVETN